MEATVKFILIAVLTIGLLPGGPELVVEGNGPACVATARGDVETFLVLYYDHDDPADSGSPFTYVTPVRVLGSGAASVAYDWGPVAVQWYGRAAGTTDRFKQLRGGCGLVPPKNVSREPRTATPLTECSLLTILPMEIYARAYYLHADPDEPFRRYVYRSENSVTLAMERVVLDLAYPVGVAWYYRQCASLVSFPSGQWVLAKTCGEIPAAMPVEQFHVQDYPQRFAAMRSAG